MKKIFYSIAFFSLIASIVFTACGRKKMQTANVENNKTAETKTKTPPVKEKTVVKKTEVKKTEVAYTPLPPTTIENNFKSKYPTATGAVWTKEVPLIKVENKNARDYKVNFSLDNNNNTVIYSENGDLIESRTQISPDQLPPNVMNAIKKKYPEAHIVSASTFKNSKINGSYSAIIKPQAQAAAEKEVILMENGTFVE